MKSELFKYVIGVSGRRKLTSLEAKIIKEWQKRIKHICKPCWELKYCPYGPLVENFPLLGATRSEAVEHNEFLKEQLKKGAYTGRKKREFKKDAATFNPNEYPVKHNKKVVEMSCSVFGHMCPVFFVNEPLTETSEARRISRNISREVMLKVVRRDNSTCQICGQHLLDKEIEFDHIIPFSKGGSTEESNIRVTCFDCNRAKTNKFPVE